MGGGLFLIASVPIGIGMMTDGELAHGLLVALLPLLIAAGGTCAGMVFVGLPATSLIMEEPPETRRRYERVGALGGAVLPTLALIIVEGSDPLFVGVGGFFLGCFGALAGLTAGSVWGRWRESLAQRPAATTPAAPINPIHDLLF
ncbi:hypothetical protein [Aurantiacibacter luteus]|uniref:Uncharacterized protein n=1 Tax=Aurantiacibacter luteus TaxID=1581420 RepID=A0A0G9MV00_9SPHN|nr:hypothetical protein [Aurantiacibacter luteus]KLE34520.1 hypothetical protein AAW00_09910 [Aurantiacibacter luteus]